MTQPSHPSSQFLPYLACFVQRILPARTAVIRSLSLFAFVVGGSFLIYPITSRMPMLGWDWYFFFSAHNPSFNIYSPTSAYPPFTSLLLDPLIRLPWRTALALLNGIALLSVAVAAWLPRRSYSAVVLALATPPIWFLLWIGHPDGLALLGLVTGFVPLALIKPQLTIWSLLRTRAMAFWTVAFLLLSLALWPGWPLSLRYATFAHPAAFGWTVTGWPVVLIGLAMLVGAGSDPYRLMAAGCLLSPYLMPYNLAVLLPAIGSSRGTRRVVLWQQPGCLSSAWAWEEGPGISTSFSRLPPTA